jgi:raffinose synthase
MNAEHDTILGTAIGLVSTAHIYRFFHDYHNRLRLQGVDGVKVDVQAIIESIGAGSGGRVELMRRYHEALEGSVQTHFLGNVINCMSCTNEMLYAALNSTLTRTSDDFFPARPASQGLHIYANAFVSLWFGEFVHPDWDMFQSGHELGAFHAAARAISGGPVYVSDKPGAHDFDLLRKLVLPDGTVLRARNIGRPTRDCLFNDPTRDDAPLKIFNLNLESGIVGAFNARYDEAGTAPVTGTISPEDVDGLAGDRFAVYSHRSHELRRMDRNDKWDIELPQLTCDLFTVVPVDDGVAPIGLADMLNSAGAITGKGWASAGRYRVELKAGGRVLVWCEREPAVARYNDEPIAFATAGNAIELVTESAGSLELLFD